MVGVITPVMLSVVLGPLSLGVARSIENVVKVGADVMIVTFWLAL